MNKKHTLVIPLLALALSGCANDNQAFLDFISSIHYNEAYTNTNKAYLETVATFKNKEEELLGSKIERFYFDKVNEENLSFSHYLKLSGDFVKEKEPYFINHKITKVDSKYLETKVVDEETTTKEVSKTYIFDQIQTFFFTSNLNAGKTGGYYYGDEVKQLKQLQDKFKVKNNILIYDTENHMAVENYYSKLYYELNSTGMLLNRVENSLAKDGSLILDMKTTIKYNNEATYDASKFEEIKETK